MKKYLLGTLALLTGICLSTHTPGNPVKKPLSGEKWFLFNGTDPVDLNNASTYSLGQDGSSPTVCINTTFNYRCEIYAVPKSGDPSHPDLSTIRIETKRTTP